MRSRIMYIESKAESLNGPARIGRVTFNRTGRTLFYKGQSFQSLKGQGFKANYYETETGAEYWISGPRLLLGIFLEPSAAAPRKRIAWSCIKSRETVPDPPNSRQSKAAVNVS